MTAEMKVVDLAAAREKKARALSDHFDPLPWDEHEAEANRRGAEFYNFGWSTGDYGDWFGITSKTSRGRFSTSRHAETGEVEHFWHNIG